ncbi:hypothetical protein D3C86_1558490 [compost metagenome]
MLVGLAREKEAAVGAGRHGHGAVPAPEIDAHRRIACARRRHVVEVGRREEPAPAALVKAPFQGNAREHQALQGLGLSHGHEHRHGDGPAEDRDGELPATFDAGELPVLVAEDDRGIGLELGKRRSLGARLGGLELAADHARQGMVQPRGEEAFHGLEGAAFEEFEGAAGHRGSGSDRLDRIQRAPDHGNRQLVGDPVELDLHLPERLLFGKRRGVQFEGDRPGH